MRTHAMSLPEDRKVWVITISFNGPEHIHTCLRVLCVKEQRLFVRLCPLTHQSGHHSVWSGVISKTECLPVCLWLLPLLLTVSHQVSHHGLRVGEGQKRFTQ